MEFIKYQRYTTQIKKRNGVFDVIEYYHSGV